MISCTLLSFRTQPNSATLKDKLKSATLTPSTTTATTAVTSTAAAATKAATNFARNTAKYATLPARRSKELSAAIVAEQEADNISDGGEASIATCGGSLGGNDVQNCGDLSDGDGQS